MNNLKVGMVVRLKSGGPKMTIDKISDDQVVCRWFLEGKVLSDLFYPESLVEVKQKEEIKPHK